MRLVGILAAAAIALGTAFTGLATANVSAVCTQPGLVKANVYNFVNPGTHTVEVWTNLTPTPVKYNVVGRQNNYIDLTVPEGDVTVYMRTDGKTYQSPSVHCATPPVPVTPENPNTTPDQPQNPEHPVTPKPPKKPVVKITTKRFEVVVNKVPCFTPKSGARAYVDKKTVVRWYKNGKLYRTKTSPVTRVYGAACAVNG